MQLFVTEWCVGCSCLLLSGVLDAAVCVGCSCLLLSGMLDAAVCY